MMGLGVLTAYVSVFLIAQEVLGQPLWFTNVKKDDKLKYPRIFGNSAIKRLIEDNGMKYENYTVTSEDGWILNLNRIVNPDRKGEDRGFPVFLINGFFMHSEAWLVQPRKSWNIGLQFARKGYDVWLGDQRGTMRSKKHVNLTEKDPKFFDYSFHESGLYDTSAFIDFILQKTGYKSVIFSCMSLGCSFHAILASMRPEYNEKIKAAIYFVPLVNNVKKIQEMGVMFNAWFKLQFFSVASFESSGSYDILPDMGRVRKEAYYLCKPAQLSTILSMMWVFGPYIHMPAEGMCAMSMLSIGGTNVKSAKHILQVYNTGDFAQYDYGREENRKRYGTDLPPLYDMKKITSFLAIYYSDKDMFASVEGVKRTIKSVGGPTYDCMMPNFNHLDVATGTTFHYVLPDVIELMDALTGYNNNTQKLQSGSCPSMEWIRNLRY